LSVFHVIYGLRVASDLPLPGLIVSTQGGPVDLHIRFEQSEKFAHKFSTSLSNIFYSSPDSDGDSDSTLRVGTIENGGYFGFFYGDGVRFVIEHQGFEIWGDWPENYAFEDACTYLVGPVIAFVLRLRGITCLHASAVVVDGRAIALFGLAGAGKSTTAAAFALDGISVLSDDVAVLADRGNHFFIQPGYPRVNLWPDSVRTLFGSGAALPHITPTWDKRYLALGQDGRPFASEPLPLGAIYVLGDREANLTAPVIEEMVGTEAMITLVANTYVNYLLNCDMRRREFDVLGRVLAGVPVRRVRPTADPSKVFGLCEMIAGDAKQFFVHDSFSASQEGA
jgi:hypothetical protein